MVPGRMMQLQRTSAATGAALRAGEGRGGGWVRIGAGAADLVLLNAGLRRSAARRMHARSQLARTHAARWVWAAGEGEAKQEDMTYIRRTLKNKSVQGSFLERQCWLVCVALRPFSLILLHSEYVL